MIWGRKNFGLEIIEDFNIYFKDKRPGILHYPDGSTGDKLPTMSILNRAYYDIFGYWYFKKFRSVCADNHYMEAAKRLNAYRYVHKQMYIHAHPVWGYADWDRQYYEGELPVVYAQDFEVLKWLRENNLGIPEKYLT